MSRCYMTHFTGCVKAARAVAVLKTMAGQGAMFHIALTNSDHNLLLLEKNVNWLGKYNDILMPHSSIKDSVLICLNGIEISCLLNVTVSLL